MFRFLRTPPRAQGRPLNETQRALVEKKFEMLREASFGFTQDRLLHIQADDLKGWTDACTDELRKGIVAAAPAHIKIALVEFRELRCVSLQCLRAVGDRLVAPPFGRARDEPVIAGEGHHRERSGERP